MGTSSRESGWGGLGKEVAFVPFRFAYASSPKRKEDVEGEDSSMCDCLTGR